MYESEVCVTCSDCVGIKKKTYSISFIIRCSWKYTCIVYFLLLRWRVHHGSRPALCLLKKEGREGNRGGARFSDMLQMSHVFKKEKTKSITYQPTVWSVVIQYTVFICFLANIFQCLSCGVILFDWVRNWQFGQEASGRRDSIFLTPTRSGPSCGNAGRFRNIIPIRGWSRGPLVKKSVW